MMRGVCTVWGQESPILQEGSRLYKNHGHGNSLIPVVEQGPEADVHLILHC